MKSLDLHRCEFAEESGGLDHFFKVYIQKVRFGLACWMLLAWLLVMRLCAGYALFLRRGDWSIARSSAASAGSYSKHLEEALDNLDQQNAPKDYIALCRLLQDCGKLGALSEGRRLHDHIVRFGLERDMFVGNHIMNMYGTCGSMQEARKVFDRMPRRNVVSWNCIIAAYAQNGDFESREAIELFWRMQVEGVKPNAITFVNVLNACCRGAAQLLHHARIIHMGIGESGFEPNVIVATALVNMYGKCGSVFDAWILFCRMPERNVFSWTAMITAYAQHGHGKEALKLLKRMQLEGFNPDRVTFVTVLDACADMATLAEGKLIQKWVVESGVEFDDAVGNAHLNMYSKCGSLQDARNVFDVMQHKTVVSWNVMITAYAQHGHGNEAVQLFRELLVDGVKPDSSTHVGILSAFTHMGLLDEACKCFTSMVEDHGVPPTVKHFGCMIDLLGRAGRLDEAAFFIDRMPEADAVAWTSLLGACRSHGDMDRARRAMQHVAKFYPCYQVSELRDDHGVSS